MIQQPNGLLHARRRRHRFIVDADFVLASSRMEIKGDEPWNLFLRDCLVKTYVEKAVPALTRQRARLPQLRFMHVQVRLRMRLNTHASCL